MPHTNRFSAIARIVGAFVAAALITLAAAPTAMAQNTQRDFQEVDITPTESVTYGGFFSVTFQFNKESGDTNGKIVQGFTHSDISFGGAPGAAATVTNISRAATTNIYTVSIRAKAGFSGSLTVILKDDAVTWTDTSTDPDTDYQNTRQEITLITIDQEDPTVALTARTLTTDDTVGTPDALDNGKPLVDGKFQVEFDFTGNDSDTVTGFTLSDVEVYENNVKRSDRTSNFVELSDQAGKRYTVDIDPTAGFTGKLKVVIPGGVVTDLYGNMIQKTELEVMVDRVKPGITITAPSQWGNETFMATVKFTEDVVNTTFTAADIVVATTPTAETAPSVTLGQGVLNSDGSETFSVTIGVSTATTTKLAISIAADKVNDIAGIGAANTPGNGNTASNTVNVAIDAARPTIVFGSPNPIDGNGNADLTPTGSPAIDRDSFTVDITFSEDVIGFQNGSPADITVTNGTVTLVTDTTNNIGILPGASFRARVTPTDDYEGPITIAIPANAAYSENNNAKGNPGYSTTVTVSQGKPSVVVTADKTRTNGTFVATFTFSENVTGFVENDISFAEGGNVQGWAASNFRKVSEKVYTATITAPDNADDDPDSNPPNRDSVTISVGQNVAKDIVGNNNIASPSSGDNQNPQVFFDDTKPTVDISAPGAASGKFNATFTFSEELAANSFTAADITVTGGTKGTVQGAGTTFTLEITPNSGFSGNLTIAVPADGAKDIAGNNNVAYDSDTSTTDVNEPWTVSIDRAKPTVTLTPASLKENGPFTMTIDFNEPVTGLTTDDFVVPMISTGNPDNTSTLDVDESQVKDASVSNIQGGGMQWTATVTPRAAADNDDTNTPELDERKGFSGDGTKDLDISIKADAVTDAAGNGNAAASFSFVVDGTPVASKVQINTVQPTLTTITTNDDRSLPTGTTTRKHFNGAFTATFTFSEDVTGFDAGDITLTSSPTDAGVKKTEFKKISDKSYSVLITPTPDNKTTTDNDESYEGEITITVAAAAVTDTFGNDSVDKYDSNPKTTDVEQYKVKIDTTKPVPVISEPVGRGSLTFYGHEEDLKFAISFKNGSNGSNEDVIETDLAAADFEIKHMNVSKVVNDNATPDNAADDTSTYVDGLKESGSLTDLQAEQNDGAVVVANSIKTVEVDGGANTYTAMINPAPFSPDSTPVTIDFISSLPNDSFSGSPRSAPLNGSKDTITMSARRKLRISLKANAVTDLAGNMSVEYDSDTGTTGNQAREIQLRPEVPTITITTPGLPTAAADLAFNGNQLSKGTPFKVRFSTGSQSLGVFGVEDVRLTDGAENPNVLGDDQATLTEFTKIDSTTYEAKVTPAERTYDSNGAVTAEGYSGNLAIEVAANINGLSNFAASKTVYVDQIPPEITSFTGLYLADEDGNVENSVIDVSDDGTPRLSGAFYVKFTSSEEIDLPLASKIKVYKTGDATKKSVGSATEFTSEMTPGLAQNWVAKIVPNANFNGNISVEIEAGIGVDRADRPAALSSDSNFDAVLNPRDHDNNATTPPRPIFDTKGPAPIISFLGVADTDVVPDRQPVDADKNFIRVVAGSKTSFKVKILHQNGDETDSSDNPVYEQVDATYDGETNFSVSDIVVTPSAAGKVTALTATGTGAAKVWVATITPTADTDEDEDDDQPWEGTLTLSIPAAAYKDTLGNLSTATATATAFTAIIDKTAPKLKTISQTVDVIPDVPFTLEFEFDGPVSADINGTGGETDAELEKILAVAGYNGTISSPTNWTVQSEGDGYSITEVMRINPLTSKSKFRVVIELDTDEFDADPTNSGGLDLDNVAVYAAAGSATSGSEAGVKDTAGNLNPVSYERDSKTNNVKTGSVYFTAVIDRTSPYVTIVRDADEDDAAKGHYAFEFTFSHLIQGFEESDFVVTDTINGKPNTVVGEVVDGSLTQDTSNTKVWTAKFTSRGNGDLVIKLPKGRVSDAVNNPNIAAEYRHDLGRPSAEIVVVKQESGEWVVDTSTVQKGNFHIEVRFTEDIKLSSLSDLPISLSGGTEAPDPREWLNKDGDAVTSGSGTIIVRTYRTQINPSALVNGKGEFTLMVGVPAGAVTDKAANFNTIVTRNVMIDRGKPTVTITPNEVGNNFSNGNIFDVFFAFSEPVTGFGLADITALTGGEFEANSLMRMTSPNTYVSHTSADTANPEVFGQNYKFQIDPSSGATSVSFSFAADKVMDLAGNNNLAYDSDPDTANVQPHTISVDAVMPTPEITGAASVNGKFPIKIVFYDKVNDAKPDPFVGEDVTGFTQGDLTVAGGVVSDFRPLNITKVDVGGSKVDYASEYTANITPNTGATTVTIDIAASKATDGAGNNNEAAAQYTATINSNLPYVTRIVTPVAGGSEFKTTIHFSEAVDGFIASDVTVTDGTVKNAAVTTVSDTEYSMVIVPTPAVADDPATTDVDETAPAFEGDLSISVKANAATAKATPLNRQTVASAIKYVRIDRTAPEITAFTLNGGSPVKSLDIGQSAFNVSITFDEDMDLTTWEVGDLTVAGGTVTSVSNTGNRVLTATVNTPLQQATVSLAAGKVKDIAGNGNLAHTGASIGRAVDRPTVSVAVVDGNASSRSNAPFDVRVTFNQAVTGFDLNDLTVTNGQKAQFNAAPGGNVYTARITPNAGQTSVTVKVNENVANNSGGLGNHVSNTLTVTISTSSRTVTIISTAQSPVTGGFYVNVTFGANTPVFPSSAVTVLHGFVTPASQVAGMSKNPQHVSQNRNWRMHITPTGTGSEVSVYLVGNVISGGNAPSNVFKIQSDVEAPPPVTLKVEMKAPKAVKAGASQMTVDFMRGGVGVDVTGFELNDLSVNPTTVVLSDLTAVAGKKGSYTVMITPPALFEGEITVTLRAEAATDLIGNKSPASTVTTKVDTVPPTVAIAGPAGPANGAVELTFSFKDSVEGSDDSVTGFDKDDIAVGGDAGATVGDVTDVTGKGAVYKATVTPSTDFNGQLTVNVAAGVAIDDAGNESLAAAEQYAVTIDQTPPTVTVTGQLGQIGNEKSEITITFTEEVTGFESSDIKATLVKADGSSATLTTSKPVEDADTKGLYKATIQATEAGVLTVSIDEDAADDLAGNGNMATEDPQYSVEIVLDTTFTVQLKRGLNLLHVPVKDDNLKKVSDLYTHLGGASDDVAYILSYVPPVAPAVQGSFAAYIGNPGSSGDIELSHQTAVIVNMKTAKSVDFTGGLLDPTVSLMPMPGINLIGVPRANAMIGDKEVKKASDIAKNTDIAENAIVLVLSPAGLFEVARPGTTSDVDVKGGVGYIVVFDAKKTEEIPYEITYAGDAWDNESTENGDDTAPSTIASADALKFDPTATPVLLVEGSFAREDTLEPINGLSVSIKNLRTGESVVDTAGLKAGSGRFVKPMIDLRGGSYEAGDAFEVSVVDPSGTFGGLTPIRAVVSKDEIAEGRIDIGRHLLSAVPDLTALLPNYPNPFNPETWIPFDLAKSSQVTVTVYNAAGQTVRVLELGQLPAGQYRSRSKAAYWDGRNALGERVSSGLYFYRIEAGSFSALRRMVILK